MKKNIFLFAVLLITTSCASTFRKGGAYKSEGFNKTYYINKKSGIKISFSDRYVYRKENFNATKLTPKTEKLLKDFNIVKPKNILFSYDSGTRAALAILISKSQIDFDKYQHGAPDKNQTFYYSEREDQQNLYLENLYPYKNKYVRVIERSSLRIHKKPTNHQTFIFPEITILQKEISN